VYTFLLSQPRSDHRRLFVLRSCHLRCAAQEIRHKYYYQCYAYILIIIEVCSTCEIGCLWDAGQPSPGAANPDPPTPKPKEQPTPCDASPTFSARLYDDAPHNMLLSIEKLRGIALLLQSSFVVEMRIYKSEHTFFLHPNPLRTSRHSAACRRRRSR